MRTCPPCREKSRQQRRNARTSSSQPTIPDMLREQRIRQLTQQVVEYEQRLQQMDIQMKALLITNKQQQNYIQTLQAQLQLASQDQFPEYTALGLAAPDTDELPETEERGSLIWEEVTEDDLPADFHIRRGEVFGSQFEWENHTEKKTVVWLTEDLLYGDEPAMAIDLGMSQVQGFVHLYDEHHGFEEDRAAYHRYYFAGPGDNSEHVVQLYAVKEVPVESAVEQPPLAVAVEHPLLAVGPAVEQPPLTIRPAVEEAVSR